MTDRYSFFRQQIFDVSVAQIEAMIKPDGILDYFRRETMALI